MPKREYYPDYITACPFRAPVQIGQFDAALTMSITCNCRPWVMQCGNENWLKYEVYDAKIILSGM